jgi:YD repeat-containing protein
VWPRPRRAQGARGRLRGESGLERLELLAGQDPFSAAEQWRSLPEVEFAEPNYLVRRDQVGPDDPRFGEQWALRNEGQAGGASGSDINAAGAWAETTGARTTVVAVVDSGVDFAHPDLKNNRWANPSEVAANGEDDDRNGLVDDTHGWDFVADSGVIRDEQGHGTSVAGLIAAEGDNGAGIAGVMWQAGVMSLRVLDSAGTGDVAAAVEAIDYAVRHGAQVINCSWGTEAESRFLRDAIERAGSRGVVVVASAGNSGRDIDAAPYYPASYDLQNLISVASTDGFDQLAQFSNRGATRVTVAAPGMHLLTTSSGGDYHLVTGTSASAPLVAGVVGLIKTLRPTLGAAQVRAAVVGGVRPVEGLTGQVSAGGVADAAGALDALRGNPRRGNGEGQGGGRPYVPPALRDDHAHGRARGKEGRVVEAPETVEGAPGPGLPDLDESRRVRTSPETEAPAAPIHANLPCLDCDSSGGGGGGASYPSDPYFATARTRPVNETGEPGVTLGSRNFNWGLPLVSLPGRAGLDLSLALHYNSLVWTKQGTSIQYNADHGTPGPGFQLGLPRLQARHLNSDTNTYAYVMVTPSGGRVELMQVGTTNVYDARDGSFARLTFEGATPVVRATDGTQYRFGTQAGAEWRCTQIKDRNGNYVSATYNAANGHLLTVTDTLGRVVNFNYNADGNLSTVTQTWGGAAHTYATFAYGTVTMSFNFSGLTVFGAASGASQAVLSSVTLSTGESYGFDYNGYG